MAEYIEREAAIARIKKYTTDVYGVDLDSTEQYSSDKFTNIFCDGLWSAKELINNITAADVAPVVYGQWEPGNPICPVCGGNKFKDLDADIWCDWQPDFCPNCGAKMDGSKG